MSHLQDQRGSITILVLVFVILLTFIVVAFLEEAASKIKYYGLFHNRDDLRTDAYSAMEISLAIINQYREIEGSLWGPIQGWGKPLEKVEFVPAHATVVEVHFEDESAKLPLANLEYDALLTIFEVLGFEYQERQELADGLLDWTDEGDDKRASGFDGQDYEDFDPPYKPANGPITSWDEFKLIVPFNTLFWDETGKPVPQWEQFRSMVSLYYTGVPNINQASATLLYLWQEKGLIDYNSLMRYKSGSDGELGTEDDRLLREPDGQVIRAETAEIGTTIELLRVKTTAIRGDARFELECLVSWSGANPSANQTKSALNQNIRNSQIESADPNTAAEQRRRARGSAKTAPGVAADLGYPFRFIRITENRKF
jgi:general secretion pathway protein K